MYTGSKRNEIFIAKIYDFNTKYLVSHVCRPENWEQYELAACRATRSNIYIIKATTTLGTTFD